MNILVVTTEIGTDGGGMALSCRRIVDILSTEHNVHVLSSTYYPIYTAKGGINPLTETGIRKEYKLKEDALKYSETDVVIAFGARFNGYYASLLAERLGKRFIIALRGSDINIVKWSIEDTWYLREAVSRSSKVICLSKEMVKNLLSLCPSVNGNAIIIPNEYEGGTCNVTFPHLPSSVVIGTAAAHLNEKKGIGNLIKMLSIFKKMSDIDIRLELVGDIDLDLFNEYSSIIEVNELQDNIKFYGYESRERLINIMCKWDFYIQTSVCEGHPNAIAECLQCGTGFMSSNTGYIAEILSNDYPEFFFDSFEPVAIATSLIALIKMTNKEIKYRDAFNELQSHCSKLEVSNKWLNLLSYNKTKKEDMNIENIVAVGLHDVLGDIHDSITTPVKVFDDFVKHVAKKGYGLCSMHEYIQKSKEERRQWIVCTFDDGYKSLTNEAYKILKRYDFSATVFICTDLIGCDNTWNNKDAVLRKHLNVDDIQKLKDAGWEIASHGVLHKNLLKLSDPEIEYELSESKKRLENLIGYCESYAYPYGAYNKCIRRCVEKYYKYAFSVDQGGTSMIIDRYQLKRYSITEIYKMIN